MGRAILYRQRTGRIKQAISHILLYMAAAKQSHVKRTLGLPRAIFPYLRFMRRARNELNPGIGIGYNDRTGYYEAIEQGITYQLTLTQLDLLKRYYRGEGFLRDGRAVTRWFLSLDQTARKEIKRLNVPDTGDPFFPDVEYSDF